MIRASFFLVIALVAGCAPTRQVTTANPVSTHCSTNSERARCMDDPKNCPCEAYGDCEMGNCIAKGEAVAQERAQVVMDEVPREEVRPVAPARPDTGPRRCGSDADFQQCGEESYYCPCEAYGDCGRDHCVEPRIKPREADRACVHEDDRSECRHDPSKCPCSTHGLCEMRECSLSPAPSTPPPPPVRSEPPPAAVAPPAEHPCSTESERATCRRDPWSCTCEAYGDCGMGNCKG